MDHQELVARFSQSVGTEKAEALIAEALVELDIEPAETYTHHEIADICETIKRSNEGYIRLVANEIRVSERAQRRFDALLDEITDPIVTVAFEEMQPVVTGMNPAFETTFGYDQSAIGQPLPSLLEPDDDRSEPIDRWARAERDGSELECEMADGESRTFLFRPVVVTRENGDVEGYGIYTDITERKRRERRLEIQNEQLDRFASVVSHDLRNPLTIAQGRLELAIELANDEAVLEQLRPVVTAQDRMESLVDDLLMLARQGRVVDETTFVGLGGVVRDAWSSVSTTGTTIELENPDIAYIADRSRLRQLFENLFRNAVEHGCNQGQTQRQTQHQTQLRSGDERDRSALESDPVSGDENRDDGDESTPLVTIRVGELADGRTGFFVEDDGPGIDPSERETVFEHGHTTHSDGTGFGLAIVKVIVDAHDWSIDITDGRTGGARFEISDVDRPEEESKSASDSGD